MAVPAILNCHAQSPDGVLFGASHLMKLFEEAPFGYAHEPIGKVKGGSQFFQLVRKVRQLGPTTALMVERNFRSAAVVRFAGVRRRVGHSTECRGPLLTHSLPYDFERFEAESYLDLLRLIHIETPVSKPLLWISEAERDHARKLIPPGAWGFQPGSLGFKSLPRAVSQAVIDQLAVRHLPIVLLGGAEERLFLEGLTLPERTLDLVGKTNLRETMAVLASVDRFIAADTGLVHIAAALGTPTRSVFGRTSASKWGQPSEPHRYLKVVADDLSQLSAADFTEVAFG